MLVVHVKDLIRTFRPVLFSFRFVGLAVLTFYCNGFCATISGVELQKRFEVIAKAANGKVGVAVELLETKESIVLNDQERFPMQSVYKKHSAWENVPGRSARCFPSFRVVQRPLPPFHSQPWQ